MLHNVLSHISFYGMQKLKISHYLTLAKVMIKYNDKIQENTTYYPLGEVENPLLMEDILEKFRLLNPKFNMNKLQIIKHMEDNSIRDVLSELGLLDN